MIDNSGSLCRLDKEIDRLGMFVYWTGMLWEDNYTRSNAGMVLDRLLDRKCNLYY